MFATWPNWKTVDHYEIKRLAKYLLLRMVGMAPTKNYNITDIDPVSFKIGSFGNAEDSEIEISFFFSMNIDSGALTCKIFFERWPWSYLIAKDEFRVSLNDTDDYLYRYVEFQK